MATYWKDVFQKAWSATTFLALNKMVIGLSISILGVFLRHLAFRMKWSDVWEIVLTAGISYVLVLIIAFFINLVRMPAIMHQEQQAEISSFKSQSQLDPIEQRRREFVSSKLLNLTQAGKNFLTENLGKGWEYWPSYEQHELRRIQGKFFNDGLLEEKNENGRRYYRIKPEFERILHDLLSKQ